MRKVSWSKDGEIIIALGFLGHGILKDSCGFEVPRTKSVKIYNDNGKRFNQCKKRINAKEGSPIMLRGFEVNY